MYCAIALWPQSGPASYPPERLRAAQAKIFQVYLIAILAFVALVVSLLVGNTLMTPEGAASHRLVRKQPAVPRVNASV